MAILSRLSAEGNRVPFSQADRVERGISSSNAMRFRGWPDAIRSRFNLEARAARTPARQVASSDFLFLLNPHPPVDRLYGGIGRDTAFLTGSAHGTQDKREWQRDRRPAPESSPRQDSGTAPQAHDPVSRMFLSWSLSSFSPPCPCNPVDVGSGCTRILGCVKRPVSTLRGTGVAGPRAEFVSSLAG